jgi:hypothetical protein
VPVIRRSIPGTSHPLDEGFPSSIFSAKRNESCDEEQVSRNHETRSLTLQFHDKVYARDCCSKIRFRFPDRSSVAEVACSTKCKYDFDMPTKCTTLNQCFTAAKATHGFLHLPAHVRCHGYTRSVEVSRWKCSGSRRSSSSSACFSTCRSSPAAILVSCRRYILKVTKALVLDPTTSTFLVLRGMRRRMLFCTSHLDPLFFLVHYSFSMKRSNCSQRDFWNVLWVL